MAIFLFLLLQGSIQYLKLIQIHHLLFAIYLKNISMHIGNNFSLIEVHCFFTLSAKLDKLNILS